VDGWCKVTKCSKIPVLVNSQSIPVPINRFQLLINLNKGEFVGRLKMLEQKIEKM
jgi:hypothetical protein